MFSDFHFIFNWWLTIFLLGILSLPITVSLFNKFWDKGYIFSKTVSLILLTYFSLIFGVFKLIPFTYTGLLFLITIFILFDVWFLLKNKTYKSFFSDFKKHYRVFIFEELIFFLILTLWSYVRGFAPDIEGLEKYMDWGFVNSALRSQFLPPQDMWFAGETINYYYFGHLIFALITKLSTVISSVGYNLSIATVCSLTFVSAFSLVSNITYLVPCPVKGKVRKGFRVAILAGLISALLLTFGGNLHSLYKIIKLDYQQNNNHFILNQKAISKATNSYWYPDATRFIGHDPDTNDKTIHEFPLYSFVVSDLHGHMNDIFIVILFLAFLFITVEKSKNFFNWKFIVGSGFVLSICYMTNAWDFAVYGLVLAVFSFLINANEFNIRNLAKTFINGLLVIAFWYLFSYPFSLNFIPMMEGIKIADGHSPFYQLLILYGGFWLICLPFSLTIPFRKKITKSDFFVFSLILIASLLILIPELIYIKDIYIYEYRRANTMFKLVYQAFILYSLSSGYVLIRFSYLFKSKIIKFIYFFCFLTVFFIHMFYPYFAIKSYYNDLKNYKGLDGLKYLEKLYPDNYQAVLWINQNISSQPVMLEAVGDSYTTFNQISSTTGLPTVEGWIVHEWLWRGGYDAPAARQTDVDKIYNFFSTSSTENIENNKDQKAYTVQTGDSLWNIAKNELKNEFLWIEIAKVNNLENPSIIHPNQRLVLPVEFPKTEFNSETDETNLSEVKDLLSKYKVEYIFIGAKEYEKYKTLDPKKFEQIGAKVVFQSGQTSIYRL